MNEAGDGAFFVIEPIVPITSARTRRAPELPMTAPVSLPADSAQATGEASDAASDIECRLVGADQKESWNTFVASRSDANLGHDFEWREVFERSYRKKCHSLAAFRGDECVGILPLVHMSGFLSDGRLVSLPFLDQAGALAESPEVAQKLTDEAIALARKIGASGVELRALSTSESTSSERVTHEHEMPESSEALWKSFKPKVRNQIRKSEKGELVTEKVDPERLPEFYRVFCENMRDLGSPVHSAAFLEEVFSAFGDRAALYLIQNAEKRVVGGAIAIQSGGRVTVPWASSLREVFKWCPNHSLYWKILSDCADSEVAGFDFGRSWIGAGTHKFKVQWGAVEKPLAWSTFDREGKPIASGGVRPSDHSLAVRVWSRLPLGIANRFGPIIRRKLSN